MTELADPRPGPTGLAAWQQKFLDDFLHRARQDTVLVAPLGMGKTRLAGEIAAAVAKGPARVLVAAPLEVGRQLARRAEEAGLPTLELTKARLREFTPVHAEPIPEAAVVLTSPQVFTDRWSTELIASLPWDLVIMYEPPIRSLLGLRLLMERSHARTLVLSYKIDDVCSDSLLWAASEGGPPREPLVVSEFPSNLLADSDLPGPALATRFKRVQWDRDERELEIVRLVDDMLQQVSSTNYTRIQSLQRAAASSHFALQAATLRMLDRLRDERNVAVHLGRGERSELLGDAVTDDPAAIIELCARLERLASAIDELETDTKRNAFDSLVLGPGSSNARMGIVVFCALSATADYVTSGLQFMGKRVVRPSNGRPEYDEIDWALGQPDGVVVVHDGALKGLDLRSAKVAVNYDLVPGVHRMHIRWSRLNWASPDQLSIWSLIPGATASLVEQEALARMPYLASH